MPKKKKRITTNPGRRVSSRDPTLEIDISDKGITDTGFDAFLDALLECMHYRDVEHPDGAAKVTELRLNGNQLSVQSLAKLTEVVALSGADLRELDLSSNCIEVRGEDGKSVWLAFLKAFEGSFVLKKVDFSRNVLGIAGVEMLARAYLQSGLDFAEGEGLGLDDESHGDADGSASGNGNGTSGEDEIADDMVVLSVTVNGQGQGQNGNGNGRKTPFEKAKARHNGMFFGAGLVMTLLIGLASMTSGTNAKSSSDLKHYACKRGLRSVPFIIVTDISMTAGAAVHLASMVLVHKYPDTLLDYLPGGKVPILPIPDGRDNGLVYLPNDGMGEFGQRLLQSAETLRRFATATDPDENELYRGEKLREFEDDSPMDLLEQRRKHAKLTTDYTRIAKRVRLHALLKEGVEASDIWHAAFKMITYTRTLLMNATLGFGEQIEWKEDEDEDEPSSAAKAPDQSSDQAANASASNGVANVAGQDMQPHPLAAPHAHPSVSYAADGLTHRSATDVRGVSYGGFNDQYGVQWSGYGGQRVMTMADLVCYKMVHEHNICHHPVVSGPFFHPGAAEFERDFPALPLPQQSSDELANDEDEMSAMASKKSKGKKKPRQRKSNSNNASDAPEPTHKPSCPFSKTQGSEQHQNVLSCMCPSSFDANRSMVAFAADADGILTTAQQSTILRYATDWQSIEAERKAQGAEEYQQIWKLIDSVGCFTYSCS